LHGIPGALGGIISGIVIGAYNSGFDTKYTDLFFPINIWTIPEVNSDFVHQGGLQVGGTFTSLAIGLGFGILTGFILNLTYDENPGAFFHDKSYFELGEGEGEQEHRSEGHEKLLQD
jgi:hypothetical protein